jgi:ATP-binding cassette subfamily D (ALD) long-chain fatty acid import protein
MASLVTELLKAGAETFGLSGTPLVISGGAAASAATLMSLTLAYARKSQSDLRRVLTTVRKKSAEKPADEDDNSNGPLRVDRSVVKVGVDRRFYKQFQYILKIAVPNWRHKTILILVLHTTFLVLRTYLSVVIARIDGLIVRDLVCN